MSVMNLFKKPEKPTQAVVFSDTPFEFLAELEKLISHPWGMRILTAKTHNDDGEITCDIDVVGEVLIFKFKRDSIAFINDNNHLVNQSLTQVSEEYFTGPGAMVDYYEAFIE